ncbi:uncharacterized protein PRCAT00006054001 [Priceomyces carsonii]|uniref:uncharacterized protein n=1 Tax=Priceomyces carsonii TaxID=28549 RepID=UPI002ED9273A|nr:unnamed protein product [Priceomyces carsonii]
MGSIDLKIKGDAVDTNVERIFNDNILDSYDEEEELSIRNLKRHDLTQVEGDDPILARKMFLINEAIDEIGFTWYHLKLFCIAGFGYSADSQLEMIQSSVKTYVDFQFGRSYPVATEIFYVGLICGSVFWGFGGDLIGRKWAFNLSLFFAALFGFITGGMSSYATYCIFLFLNSFSAGGNIAMDVTVFLEYLPFKYQWLTTFLAAWWGVGQTIAVLVAWAFIPKYSCDVSSGSCPSHLNKGWRYCWYVNSGIVMAGALLRLFAFKLDETPKFLVSNGRDEEAVESLRRVAEKYKRPFNLTVEQLKDCGDIISHHQADKSKLKNSIAQIKAHVKILFSTRLVAWSSFLVLFSWFLIGISYSTFYNFLYIYIGLHGGNTGSSTYIVYRNSAISNFVGIFGPMVGGLMILIPKVGRRGTMAIGAICAMAILFAYTTVRTQKGDAGFASATYFFVNIYYGCLYAYTPEIFPAQARGTGTSLALVSCRISGSLAPVVYYYGQQSGSSIPIWVCGACIGFLAFLALLMPFEPTKSRSV